MEKLSPLDKLLADLKYQAKDLRDHICEGGCESFDDYRYASGKLESLERCYSALDDALGAEEDEE